MGKEVDSGLKETSRQRAGGHHGGVERSADTTTGPLHRETLMESPYLSRLPFPP